MTAVYKSTKLDFKTRWQLTKGKILTWCLDDLVKPYGIFCSTPSSGGAGWRFVGDTTNFMKQGWVSWNRLGIVSTEVDTFLGWKLREQSLDCGIIKARLPRILEEEQLNIELREQIDTP